MAKYASHSIHVQIVQIVVIVLKSEVYHKKRLTNKILEVRTVRTYIQRAGWSLFRMQSLRHAHISAELRQLVV